MHPRPALSSSPRLRWPVAALVALVGAGAALDQAFPCGPFFPPQLFTPRAEGLVEAPTGELQRELGRVADRLPREAPAKVSAQDPTEATYDTDVAELREALGASALAAEERLVVGKAYETARQSFRRYAGPSAEWAAEQARLGKHDPLPEWSRALQPPPGTPPEFALYLQGAASYLFRRLTEARAAWEQLLALHAEARRHRSTWAAYMLARSFEKKEPARAIVRYRAVRELARDGFADSLGLAAASHGAEARLHLRRREYVAALRGYLAQVRAGDPRAAASVRETLRRAFRAPAPQRLQQLAADPLTRGAVAAFIVSGGGPIQARGLPPRARLHAWLQAVEAVAARDVEGADRLAWAAYQLGDFAMAARFASHAPNVAPMARWVEAKLRLRDGKLAEAAALLSAALRGLDPVERWADASPSDLGEPFAPHARALAELGAVRLGRQEYEGALDALLRGGYWLDAAYVAERVLTLAELQAYVDRAWPAPAGGAAPSGASSDSGSGSSREGDSPPLGVGSVNETTAGKNLRRLLARRLVRAGRLADAQPYAAARHLRELQALDAHLRASADMTRSAEDRARALFEAARVTRRRGLELRGTEIEPDHAIYDANHAPDGPSQHRALATPGTFLPSTDDERERLRRHLPEVDKRFHYRYVAAAMGHKAALAFPPNHPEGAVMLCEAGWWLKARDPQAADPLYKALVRRNRKLSIGQRADTLRWFPMCVP